MDKFIDANRFYTRDLVLVGGGHAHVQIIKMLAMKPIPKLRVTLISDQLQAPYSGMLPGVLAGWYSLEDAHFDLSNLCARAGVRFIHDACIGIDLQQKSVIFERRSPVLFDVLSVNVGVTPMRLEGQHPQVIPVKPISNFLNQWTQLESRLSELSSLSSSQSQQKAAVAVVGGGPAGVEVSFVMARLIRKLKVDVRIDLIEASDSLLSHYGSSAQRLVRRALKSSMVNVITATTITRTEENGTIMTQSGDGLGPYKFIVNVAKAAPFEWLKESGLQTDDEGFLSVNKYLQSPSHEFVFGAGDAIDFCARNLKKSGVYAVRQGGVLLENIRRYLRGGRQLKQFHPQHNTLSLITTGKKEVIAAYGSFSYQSKWLWWLKDRIDRAFMKKWRDIPVMSSESGGLSSAKALAEELNVHINTCGACGGKVDAVTLQTALANSDSSIQWDDCAVIDQEPARLMMATVDTISDFCGDPFLLGEVSSLHATSDIIAMGGFPTHALCHVSLPHMSPQLQKRDLGQLMAGVDHGLGQYGVKLVGGHTMAGSDLSVGLTVHGHISTDRKPYLKKGAKIGDIIILTKPVGTGSVMAGIGEKNFKASWWHELINHLRHSHVGLLECVADLDVHAMTDVTGYGLAGHLQEMFSHENLHLCLNFSSIPVLSGFAQSQSEGYRASLTKSNYQSVMSWLAADTKAFVESDFGKAECLFDPQTCGGMLICLPSEQGEVALGRLKSAGFTAASIVGEVSGSAAVGSLTCRY